MSDTPPFIRATNIVKAYGAKRLAVDGMSLEIPTGTRLGIVGRNGAGKSTFLHILAGISDPTSGTLQVEGKITAVFTLGLSLRDDLSGRENIYIDGVVQGYARSQIDDLADAIIAFAELREFIDFPVRTYSTGMKARLGFAMISHIDPEILIIDEALSAGDAKFALKASAKIMEICARGKIVILVSHGMEAIRAICNRCIWMDEGRIVMDGAPAAVTQAYVETIRSEDEGELLRRFCGLAGSRSTLDGWEICELDVFSGTDRQPTMVLECRRSAGFRIRVRCGGSLRRAALRILVVRLDGFVVADESRMLECLLPASNLSRAELQIAMTPMIFGPGIYRVTASLLTSGGHLAAERTTIFETFVDQPVTGGKPVLYYRTDVDFTRLSASDGSYADSQ